ncbi:MAG: DNA/RNA nuclease SfsA [Christensenellales bacterium]|jgi:DNA-binding sugar fermentation-stimulating protein
MKYGKTVPGIFLERKNRFVALVEIDGRAETVHVKNTGRLKELLKPGAQVILVPSDNPNRKTRFDLVAAYREGRLFNIDSLAPNKVAAEYLPKLFQNITRLKPEAVRGASRLDYYLEAEGLVEEGEEGEAGIRKGASKRPKGAKGGAKSIRAFVEVKGVTLFKDGGAYFPDAPTVRGIRHLDELAECANEGFFAAMLFVVQFRGAAFVAPNDETSKAFGEALRRARRAGVRLFALECEATQDGLFPAGRLPVRAGGK